MRYYGGFEHLHQINHSMGMHPSLWLPLKLQKPGIVLDPGVYWVQISHKYEVPRGRASRPISMAVSPKKHLQLQKSWLWNCNRKNKNMFPSWCIESNHHFLGYFLKWPATWSGYFEQRYTFKIMPFLTLLGKRMWPCSSSVQEPANWCQVGSHQVKVCLQILGWHRYQINHLQSC